MGTLQGKRRREDPVRATARRRRHLWLLAVALLLTFVSALPGGLVWTDHLDLNDAGARLTDWSELPRAFTLDRHQFREARLGEVPAAAGGAWRPMNIIVNSLEWQLTDGCAPCLHAFNLLWHGLTVLGLYVLGRRVLARRPHGKTLAFWAALLFAVHPLTTVPVAFLGEHDLVLGSALAVATLVAFSRLAATSGSGQRGRLRWLLALPPLTLAAALSHEATLVLPLAALLLAWFEMRERGRSGFLAIGPGRRLGLALILATIAVYAVLRMEFVGIDPGGAWPGKGAGQVAGTLLGLFWHGLGQVFWPGEPVISDAWPIAPGLDPAAMAGLLGLVFGMGLTAWGLRLHAPVALGASWFLMWFLPQLAFGSLTRLHDDTTLYPALWGLTLAAVVLLYRLWRPLGRQLSRSAEALVFTPIVVLLALLTALSSLRFRDDQALFTGELDQDPFYLEGRVMLAADALRRGDPLQALNQGSLALESLTKDERPAALWPAADAHLLLGRAQMALALYDDAEKNLKEARRLAGSRAEPWYELGRLALLRGDLDNALSALRAAEQRRPGHLGTEMRLGEALLRAGEVDAGMALLLPKVNAGLADDPALLALTQAFAERGQPRAAIAHLELALSKRDDPVLHARLARLLWRHGRRDRAEDEIAVALARAGDEPLVREVAAEIAAGLPALPGTLSSTKDQPQPP